MSHTEPHLTSCNQQREVTQIPLVFINQLKSNVLYSGSFRDAVSQSNRIVVFAVGGVITISSRVVISHHVTIAGQTAPGGGITIYGNVSRDQSKTKLFSRDR
jgi:hypothetical protein